MKLKPENIIIRDGSLGRGSKEDAETIKSLFPNQSVFVQMALPGEVHVTVYPELEEGYEVGDMVLVPSGQKTRFFEVLCVAEDEITVTDGYIQITKKPDELELICKATNRKDARVPNMPYWNGEKGTCE